MDKIYIHGVEVSPSRRTLKNKQKEIVLTPKAMSVLMLLYEKRGEVVDKESILETCWPGRFGADDSLFKSISELRKQFTQLGSDVETIKTISKKGYVLTAEIQSLRFLDSPQIDEGSTKLDVPSEIAPTVYSRSRAIIFLSALLAALLFATFIAFKQMSTPSEPASIAVGQILDTTTEQAYKRVGLGLQEELAHQLTGLGRFKVAANSSTRHFNDVEFSPINMAEQLNVTHILQGSIQKRQEKLRLVFNLVDGESGYQVWSKAYDISELHLLEAQHSIVLDVIEQLLPQENISSVEQFANRKEISNEAYQAYLSVRPYLYGVEPEQLEAAQIKLEDLIQDYPEFDRAKIALSMVLSIRSVWAQVSEQEAFNRSETILNKLEVSRSNDPFYWLAKGLQHMPRTVSREISNWELSKASFERGLELQPEQDLILKWFMHATNLQGEKELFNQLTQRALKIDPLNVGNLYSSAVKAWNGQAYEAGLKFADKALEIDSRHAPSHYAKALILIEKGQPIQSDKHIDMCLNNAIGFMNCWEHRFMLYDSVKQPKSVLRVFDAVAALTPAIKRYIPLFKAVYNSDWNLAVHYLEDLQVPEMTAPFVCNYALASLYGAKLPKGNPTREKYLKPALDNCGWSTQKKYTALFARFDGNEPLAVQIIDEVLTGFNQNNSKSTGSKFLWAEFLALKGETEKSVALLEELLSIGVKFHFLRRGVSIENSFEFQPILNSEQFQLFLENYYQKHIQMLEKLDSPQSDLKRFEKLRIYG